ncbi:hypothetical protein ACIBO5_23945 [Nonomuraea angiospora]|uniref:hypothetical protein n=1 Tax=Nonomuraea angiospora TaxID=46172 RepID=UPI0029A12915|nr:hypothetical protein [Nonomuraea angiospora]MDX3108855.1 hypothetical protein [Nonomuraea angiospora]
MPEQLTFRDSVTAGVDFAIAQGYVPADERDIMEALHEEPDDLRILQRLRRQKDRDGPLGFGVGDLVGVLAPLLWIALDEGVRTAAGNATRSMSDRLGRIFRRKQQSTIFPDLTPAQRGVLAGYIAERVHEAGLSEAEATAVAERVIGRLGMETPPEIDEG